MKGEVLTHVYSGRRCVPRPDDGTSQWSSATVPGFPVALDVDRLLADYRDRLRSASTTER